MSRTKRRRGSHLRCRQKPPRDVTSFFVGEGLASIFSKLAMAFATVAFGSLWTLESRAAPFSSWGALTAYYIGYNNLTPVETSPVNANQSTLRIEAEVVLRERVSLLLHTSLYAEGRGEEAGYKNYAYGIGVKVGLPGILLFGRNTGRGQDAKVRPINSFGFASISGIPYNDGNSTELRKIYQITNGLGLDFFMGRNFYFSTIFGVTNALGDTLGFIGGGVGVAF